VQGRHDLLSGFPVKSSAKFSLHLRVVALILFLVNAKLSGIGLFFFLIQFGSIFFLIGVFTPFTFSVITAVVGF
jgi:hypothetical protein